MPEGDTSFRPDRHDVGRELMLVDETTQLAVDLGASFDDVLVCGRCRDIGQHGAGGRHRERVAVEGADHVVVAVRDVLHHLRRASDRCGSDPAAYRLGKAGDVGRDSREARGASVTRRQPRLYFVEGEQYAVVVQEVLQAFAGTRLQAG